MKTGLIIDSTIILSPEDIKKYGIKIVSLNVNINGEYKKELEIKDEDVTKHLEDVKEMKSSSPAPSDFEQAYEQLFKEGYEDIVVATISKNLSGTYQTAMIAKNNFDETKQKHIYLVDTNGSNFGIANSIITILPLFEQGKDGKTIQAALDEACKNSGLLFTIFDLRHLFRGGRLSKLSCAVGLLFKIKPIITMDDGRLKLIHKVRTYNNVMDVFFQELGLYCTKYKHVYIRTINLGNEVMIKQLNEKILATFKNVTLTSIDRVGPVYNVHLGDNGLGIAYTGVNE